MENYIIPHYRAVILVLASNNNTIYKNCRKIWKTYMNLDQTIKVFFVYGKLVNDSLEDYDPKSDILIDEPENLLIKKTIEAMKVIQSKVTYDFFIRTNLSTFWVLR
jgi:hypothetical protein